MRNDFDSGDEECYTCWLNSLPLTDAVRSRLPDFVTKEPGHNDSIEIIEEREKAESRRRKRTPSGPSGILTNRVPSAIQAIVQKIFPGMHVSVRGQKVIPTCLAHADYVDETHDLIQDLSHIIHPRDFTDRSGRISATELFLGSKRKDAQHEKQRRALQALSRRKTKPMKPPVQTQPVRSLINLSRRNVPGVIPPTPPTTDQTDDSEQ